MQRLLNVSVAIAAVALAACAPAPAEQPPAPVTEGPAPVRGQLEGVWRVTGVTITGTGIDVVIGGTAVASAGLTAGTYQSDSNVSTASDANLLITAIDSALDSVNGSRATLGAVQNRFESVVASLQTASESMSAARSRIMDTDFASETANMTRAQILMQAGTSMLAQANQLPQNVLSLLGN